MKKTFVISTLAALSAIAAQAGQRSSTSYRIEAETVDWGGGLSSSAAYGNVGSAGGIGGIGSVAAPAESARSGYAGQLYEVTALLVNVPPGNLNEGSSFQLGATAVLDDDTSFTLNPASVAWSNVNAPVAGLSTAGVVTLGRVPHDTLGDVRGIYAGVTGFGQLHVANTYSDDYSGYAGDGLDDAWQVQYFGQPPNANAAPGVDANGTGRTNYFKYTAGLDPLNPASVFRLAIAPVPGQPAQKALIFSPRLENRDYYVLAWDDLTGTAQYVVSTTASDSGDVRTVIDPNAGTGRKFYRVQISKPAPAYEIDTFLTSDLADGSVAYLTTVHITFSSNLPVVYGFQASLDGAAFTNTASSATITTSVNGPHTYAVRARDGAGNVDATPVVLRWTVDTIAPVLDSITPSATQTAITVAWTTNEPTTTGFSWGVGVDTSNVVLEDPAYTITHSVTISGLAPNTNHSYRLSGGHDAAGNSTSNTRRTLRTLP